LPELDSLAHAASAIDKMSAKIPIGARMHPSLMSRYYSYT
jgi:hypothetical protein